jgi:dipeptidyl aminopeptidase/acylaminoacyl peptidase
MQCTVFMLFITERRERRLHLSDATQGKPELDFLAFALAKLEGMLFLARTIYGKPSSSTDFYLANTDGIGEIRITNTGYGKGSPSWSPDGTRIVFLCSKDDTDGSLRESLYFMDSDGSHVRRLTAGRLTSDNSPAWSPNGSKFVFSGISSSGETKGCEIYRKKGEPSSACCLR